MPNDIIPPGTGDGFAVLIVEDEFLIAMDLQSSLKENGHTIVGAAGTVGSALRLLEHERPDVAVLDVNLGSQLVTPVAERLRKLDIPFVLSSASATLDDTFGEALKDAENIGKPFNTNHLIDALNRAVRRA